MKEETEKHFKEVHSKLSELFNTDKFTLAGGAINNYVDTGSTTPKDYDIFVSDFYDTKTDIAKSLNKYGYEITLFRENSTVYSKVGEVDIDLVSVPNNSIYNVLGGFDLTCCAAAISKYGFDHHEDFFKDVDSRKINILNTPVPLLTYARIAKYVNKGYVVSGEVLLELTERAAMKYTAAQESSGL